MTAALVSHTGIHGWAADTMTVTYADRTTLAVTFTLGGDTAAVVYITDEQAEALAQQLTDALNPDPCHCGETATQTVDGEQVCDGHALAVRLREDEGEQR